MQIDPSAVDELAQIIRTVDGENSLGAAALAEAILARTTLSASEAEPLAWMHPTAGWVHKDYAKIAMHCLRVGPYPIPLYAHPGADR